MIMPHSRAETLESRLLLAGSPTDVVGDGTFGGPPPPVPLHDAHITSITLPPGSTSVNGTVINVAAEATSATVRITGFVRVSGQSDPPSSHDPSLFIRVLNSADSTVLDSDNPDRSNAGFTLDFSVGP